MSVCLSLRSACLSVCLPACLSVVLIGPTYKEKHPHVRSEHHDLSVSLFVCPYVCLSVQLSVHGNVCLSIPAWSWTLSFAIIVALACSMLSTLIMPQWHMVYIQSGHTYMFMHAQTCCMCIRTSYTKIYATRFCSCCPARLAFLPATLDFCRL